MIDEPKVGRPRKLPDDDVVLDELNQPGATMQSVADKYGTSKSAINMVKQRAKTRQQDAQERALPPFPWVVSQEHTRGPVYETMLAYRRHAAGFPCDARQLKLANELRQITGRLNCAVTYDYEKGFSYTNRLDSDGDAMFVVRNGVPTAPGNRRT